MRIFGKALVASLVTVLATGTLSPVFAQGERGRADRDLPAPDQAQVKFLATKTPPYCPTRTELTAKLQQIARWAAKTKKPVANYAAARDRVLGPTMANCLEAAAWAASRLERTAKGQAFMEAFARHALTATDGGGAPPTPSDYGLRDLDSFAALVYAGVLTGIVGLAEIYLRMGSTPGTTSPSPATVALVRAVQAALAAKAGVAGALAALADKVRKGGK